MVLSFLKQLVFMVIISATLASCAASGRYKQEYDGPPSQEVDVSKIPNAVPRAEPLSRYGNPPFYYVHGKRYQVLAQRGPYKKRGVASWYGTKFHNYRTSSGEPYNLYAMTAAHRSLPLPSYVKVTNLKNKREIIVRVNDRGPFHDERLIDLSYVAARKLGIVGNGTAFVEIEALNPGGQTHPSTDPDIQSHKIYLQVGAFSQRANALSFAKKVANVTQHNVVITESTQQTALFRIQIGPLTSVEKSQALQEKISNAGLGKPLVLVQ